METGTPVFQGGCEDQRDSACRAPGSKEVLTNREPFPLSRAPPHAGVNTPAGDGAPYAAPSAVGEGPALAGALRQDSSV